MSGGKLPSGQNIWRLVGHSVERIPPPHDAWSTRTHQAQSIHFWNIRLPFVFGPISQCWRITQKKKILASRSRFGSSPKIESIRPCDTPNPSTKFRPNPSTTFWDIVLHIVFGPISQWWRITLKIQGVGSVSGSSSKSNQFVLVTHPTCPENFIQIRPQPFEISCTQTNRQTKTERGENISSFSFGGRGNVEPKDITVETRGGALGRVQNLRRQYC